MLEVKPDRLLCEEVEDREPGDLIDMVFVRITVRVDDRDIDGDGCEAAAVKVRVVYCCSSKVHTEIVIVACSGAYRFPSDLGLADFEAEHRWQEIKTSTATSWIVVEFKFERDSFCGIVCL